MVFCFNSTRFFLWVHMFYCAFHTIPSLHVPQHCPFLIRMPFAPLLFFCTNVKRCFCEWTGYTGFYVGSHDILPPSTYLLHHVMSSYLSRFAPLLFFARHGILYERKEMSSWVNRLHLFFMWDCMTSSLPPLRTCIEETNVPQGLRLLSHSFFLLTPSSPPVHSNATTYNNPCMRIPFPGRRPPSSFFGHHSPFSPVYVVIPCLSFLGSAPGKYGSAPVFSPVVFYTLSLSSYNIHYLLCMAQLRAFNSFSRA